MNVSDPKRIILSSGYIAVGNLFHSVDHLSINRQSLAVKSISSLGEISWGVNTRSSSELSPERTAVVISNSVFLQPRFSTKLLLLHIILMTYMVDGWC